MQHRLASIGLVVLTLGVSQPTHAEVAVDAHASTLGLGAGVDFGLGDRWSARLGYSAFNYTDTIHASDLRYDGDLKLRNASALLDWYVLGGFRLSVGALGSNTKVDVVAKPSGAGTYDIGGTQYTAAQVGSVSGRAKLGNSVAPYVGVGWGNPIDKDHRITFLFDVGVAYGGDPDVSLHATCGPALQANPAACARLQADVANEEDQLRDEVDYLKWYPVVSLGLAVRF
jgi:hypothetical protein